MKKKILLVDDDEGLRDLYEPFAILGEPIGMRVCWRVEKVFTPS